uniref:Uncharacterized protein n=1 Tax=viral metagenome TaxID=1070528 RepID=A0A6M3K6J1_9ZZZZ
MRTLVLTLSLPDIPEDTSRARQVFEALSEYQAAVFTNNRDPIRAPDDAVGLDGNGTFTAANGVVIREGMA